MSNFSDLKISVSLGIGLAGCYQEDTVNLSDWIDEESWQSMDATEQEKCLAEMVEDWASNYIDIGWSLSHQD